MIQYLIPFKSVGPITLGSKISDYPYSFELLDISKEYGDSYELEDEDLSVVTNKDGLIESITCEQELLFKGVNLIGLDYKVFLSHMSLEDVYEGDLLDFLEDEPPQMVYDIDEYGLMVWVSESVVVTIIVSNIEDS